MMKEVLASICMPVYNSEKFITKTLESVVNQTLENKEIIIVDDGSRDGTKKIIDEFADKYPFIKYIYQENKGVAIARQTAVNNAQGKYIGFVDADDVIENNMYELMIQEAEQNNYDIIECRAERSGELYNKYESGTYSGEKIAREYFKDYKLMRPLWLRIYKRNLFTKDTFPKKRVNNEDVFVFPCLLAKAQNYHIMEKNKILYHYNDVNQNSVMNLLQKRNYESYQKVLLFAEVRNHICTVLGDEFRPLFMSDEFKICCGRWYSEILFGVYINNTFEECLNDIEKVSNQDRKDIINDINLFMSNEKVLKRIVVKIMGLKWYRKRNFKKIERLSKG